MDDPHTIHLTTADGTRLAATWHPPQGPGPHCGLVLNSGTGIPQGFYRRFCTRAAERGFGVLRYDYRGVAESAAGPLAHDRTVYRDWGHLDVPAAIAEVKRRLPDGPLAVVGHSTGGQQLGLAHNHHQVDAALFVAVSTGYWRGMPFRQRWFTRVLWTVLVPLFRAVLGYFPASRLGLGEDLPAGVATEWGAWCLQPDYLAAFLDETGRHRSPDGRDFGPTFFDRVSFPIDALCFTDDDIATPANVPPMLDLYASRPTVRWLEPAAVDASAIGHLGFFRERVGGPLWDDMLTRLHATATAEHRGRPAGEPHAEGDPPGLPQPGGDRRAPEARRRPQGSGGPPNTRQVRSQVG